MQLWLVLAIVLGAASPAAALAPVPCYGCDLRWDSQFTLAVLDHAAGRMRLVPNIQFRGQSRDFALVIPTPALPAFSLAPPTVWTEVLNATSPVSTNSTNFGCNQQVGISSPIPAGGVTIHAQQNIGGLRTTVISSGDPQSLVDWLGANGYGLPPGDAARFAPYVSRHWFFTAMQPDTTTASGQMPPEGWNAQIQPIVLTYAADTFEVPLDLLTIETGYQAPIAVFAIDDHRMTLDGFTTEYANRLSAAEFSAMQRLYPGLATFLAPGRFLTRLQYVVYGSDPPRGSVRLHQAPTDAEFRRTGSYYGLRYAGVGPLLLVVALLAARRRARRTGLGRQYSSSRRVVPWRTLDSCQSLGREFDLGIQLERPLVVQTSARLVSEVLQHQTQKRV